MNKPGYKTSEFWMSAVAVLVGLLMSSGVIDAGSSWDKAVGLVAAALAAMGYTSNRAAVKSAEKPAE
jgi:hypothetical protein